MSEDDRPRLSRRDLLVSSGAVLAASALPSCIAATRVQETLEDAVAEAQAANRRPLNFRAIEQEAGARIDRAIELSNLDYGVPASNFERAKGLLQQNFTQAVHDSNRGAWAFSKLLWIDLVFGERRRYREAALPQLRNAARDAYGATSSTLRRTIGTRLTNAGMACALMAGDIADAQRWYETERTNPAPLGPRNSPTLALDLQERRRSFALGASIAAHQGRSVEFWRRFEASAAYSTNAAQAPPRKVTASAEETERRLNTALSEFDAVLALNLSLADSHISVCRQGADGLSWMTESLLSEDGRPFDLQSAELLYYGRTFRESFLTSSYGGWIGAYAATDETGTLSTSTTFIDGVDSISETHWAAFVGAAWDLLRRSGVTRGDKVALIFPDELSMLPVRIARRSGSTEHLVDLVDIAVSPSLRALADAVDRPSVSPNRVTAYFNDDGALSNADLEAGVLERRLGFDTFERLPDRQTVRSFLGAIERARSRVLYLSAHGRFVGDGNSGIDLGEGQFVPTAAVRERRAALSADLVVLSACELGLAAMDLLAEPSNLSTVLLGRGAKAVVSALWRVDVDATALLLSRFMELHVAGKVDGSAALGQAQRWLRDATADDLSAYLLSMHADLPPEGQKAALDILGRLSEANGARRPYRNPFYWGAFVYTGSSSSPD